MGDPRALLEKPATAPWAVRGGSRFGESLLAMRCSSYKVTMQPGILYLEQRVPICPTERPEHLAPQDVCGAHDALLSMPASQKRALAQKSDVRTGEWSEYRVGSEIA